MTDNPEKKKKKRNRILDWAPAAEVPTELSLLSVYELICYIIIFGFFTFLFIKWNKVPIREFNVYADRIDENHDMIAQASCLDVEWFIPISDLYDKEDGYCDVTCSRENDAFYHAQTQSNRLFNGNELYDRDELYSFLRKNMERGGNNWQNQPAYCIKVECSTKDFFVMRANRYSEGGVNNISKADFDKRGFFVKKLRSELYFAGRRAKLSHSMSSSLNNTPYSRPKWYSLFDISQSYFKCNIKTNTIDNIRLTMNFEGATDIYDVKYKADTIRGSGAVYNLANNNIADTDIILYARFKDQENIQSIRLFAVTAILSGMFTIFLAFLIIYIYRLFHRDLSEKIIVEQKSPEDTD